MTTDTQPHAERAHARLGPSSSARWMTCPGSEIIIPIFKAENPQKRRGSRHSDIGTIAHEVCEAMLLNQEPQRPGPLHEDDEPLTDEECDEIMGHGLAFREYVRAMMDEGDLLLIEKRVYMKRIVPTGGMFGTADVIIFKRKTGKLIVVDLKYGMSVIDPDFNSQIMLYLVGAAELMEEMGNKITGYEGHIYQPRVAGGIGGCEYTLNDIYEFTSKAIEAINAIEDRDETKVPSEKGCQWCPVNGTEYCKESAELVMRDTLRLLDELDDYEHAEPKDMAEINKRLVKDVQDPSRFDIEDLAKMYLLFGAAKKWMAKVEDYLKPRAAEGRTETLKLVEGRGSNECIDPEEVAFIVGEAAWKERQLKSKTDLTKIVGAKNFNNLLGDCFKKHPGKPTLAAISDKRDAILNNENLLAELDLQDESEV